MHERRRCHGALEGTRAHAAADPHSGLRPGSATALLHIL
jgi:hypothetical protein